jgi:hypothetical protein
MPGIRLSGAAVGLAVCLVAAGCGGSSHSAGSREWHANARLALRQLTQDVAATAVGGDSLGDARHALHDESRLYALVMAYTDVGGCDAMMRNVGAPPALEARLARPCAPLTRAAASFTAATAGSNASALLRAGHDAELALPLLVEALAEVRRA